MKHLNFLLKLSLSSLVIPLITDNGSCSSNFTGPRMSDTSRNNRRTTLDSELVKATKSGTNNNDSDLFNPVKHGVDSDVVDYVVNQQIHASAVSWANDAISNSKSKWTSSIKNLKDLISIYRKDADCNADSPIGKHRTRMNKLGDYVESILNVEGEKTKNMAIDSWKETETGKSVLSRVNGMMVCEALNLRNNFLKKDNNNAPQYSWAEYVDGINCSGLYDETFGKLTSALKLKLCVVNGKRQIKVRRQNEKDTSMLKKILAHFGYNGSTESEKNAIEKFKNYLKHDFYCYLEQIGIIKRLENEQGKSSSALHLIDETKSAQEKLAETIDQNTRFSVERNGTVQARAFNGTFVEKVKAICVDKSFQSRFSLLNKKLQEHEIQTIDFDAENVNKNINNVSFLKAIDSVLYATVGNRFDNMIASCTTFLQTFTKGCKHLPKICKLTQHDVIGLLYDVIRKPEWNTENLDDNDASTYTANVFRFAETIAYLANEFNMQNINLVDVFNTAAYLLNKQIDVQDFVQSMWKAMSAQISQPQTKLDSQTKLDFENVAKVSIARLSVLGSKKNNLKTNKRRVNSQPNNTGMPDSRQSSQTKDEELLQQKYTNFTQFGGKGSLTYEQFVSLFGTLEKEITSLIESNQIKLTEHLALTEYSNDQKQTLFKITFATICTKYGVNFGLNYFSHYPIQAILRERSIENIFLNQERIDRQTNMSNDTVSSSGNVKIVDEQYLDNLLKDSSINHGDINAAKSYFPKVTETAVYISEKKFVKIFALLRPSIKKLKDKGSLDWWKGRTSFVDDNKLDEVTYGLIMYKLGMLSSARNYIDVTQYDFEKLAGKRTVQLLCNQIFK